jgi:nucleoid DNA-binding protein
MQKRTKKIIQKLAIKYGLTEVEAEYAVKAYYEKVKEIIGEGNYPEHDTFKLIHIPNFGKFSPNVNKIKRTYAKQREDEIRKHFELRECDSLQGIPIEGQDNQIV